MNPYTYIPSTRRNRGGWVRRTFRVAGSFIIKVALYVGIIVGLSMIHPFLGGAVLLGLILTGFGRWTVRSRVSTLRGTGLSPRDWDVQRRQPRRNPNHPY